MSNYPYAKYTETFMEFLDNHTDFLSTLISLDTTEHTNKLISMLKEYYSFYEIGAETEDLFDLYFTSVYNIWRDYYIEKLNAYEKEFDYTKGITKTVANITKGKTVDYDLPNKVLSASDSYSKYPSNVNTDEGSSNSTTTDNSLLLNQKEQYMRQLKNIYLEFVLRFMDCFVPLYD